MAFGDQGKLKAITFSYDDGITQDIRLIELLNKYGLKCTFNLNSQRLGKRGVLMRHGLHISHYKIHPDDVKSIYDGHEVAAHTLTHQKLTLCEDEEIIHQVEQDRLNLSELVGYEVVGMAYPCGGVNHNDHVVNVIRNHTGMKYCRTGNSNLCYDPQEDLYRFDPTAFHLDFDQLMQMGREFVEMQPTTPKLFYIWGHSFEMDYGADYWVRLEAFFDLISNKDDIFYGTNKEVLL